MLQDDTVTSSSRSSGDRAPNDALPLAEVEALVRSSLFRMIDLSSDEEIRWLLYRSGCFRRDNEDRQGMSLLRWIQGLSPVEFHHWVTHTNPPARLIDELGRVWLHANLDIQDDDEHAIVL